jgi:hypothetical protein
MPLPALHGASLFRRTIPAGPNLLESKGPPSPVDSEYEDRVPGRLGLPLSAIPNRPLPGGRSTHTQSGHPSKRPELDSVAPGEKLPVPARDPATELLIENRPDRSDDLESFRSGPEEGHPSKRTHKRAGKGHEHEQAERE